MNLFRSKEERKMEREIQIRKGLNAIRRNIKNLENNEKGYIEKARKALEVGDQKQLHFLKDTLLRVHIQKNSLERQLLSLETAIQVKNQTEAHAQFIQSMNSLSKAVHLAFGKVDLGKCQKNFQQALTQAESLQERMDIFLDVQEKTNEEPNSSSLDEERIIEEIEAKINQGWKTSLDKEIEKEMGEIEKELNG